MGRASFQVTVQWKGKKAIVQIQRGKIRAGKHNDSWRVQYIEVVWVSCWEGCWRLKRGDSEEIVKW